MTRPPLAEVAEEMLHFLLRLGREIDGIKGWAARHFACVKAAGQSVEARCNHKGGLLCKRTFEQRHGQSLKSQVIGEAVADGGLGDLSRDGMGLP